MRRISIVAVLSVVLNVVLIVVAVNRTRASVFEAAKTASQAEASARAGQKQTAGNPLSAAAIRNLAMGQSISRLHDTLSRITPAPPSDPRYWINGAYLKNPFTPEQRAAIDAAQREFAAEIQKETGENVSPKSAFDPRRSFLSPEKLDQLIDIEDEYTSAVAAINDRAAGLKLPSDEAKLKALLEARDNATAALLTPDELAEVELRRAATEPNAAGGSVRASIAPAIETEDDYKKVVALQKVFDEKYPSTSSATQGLPILEALRRRREAEPQLVDEIRTTLGEEKFAAIASATDGDRRILLTVEQRLALPPGTAEKGIDLRTQYAAASQQIAADAGLSAQEKSAQIVALAAKAREDITSLLGPAGGPAYASRAAWVSYLSRGSSIAGSPSELPAAIQATSTLNFNSYPISAAAPAPRGAGVP